MFIANVIVVIGTVIQAAAFQRRDMIVGRVILGIGSVMLGMSSWGELRMCLRVGRMAGADENYTGPSAQSYTVEISHPAYRGTMMGLYNGCYFIGAIVSTWLEYGIVDDTQGGLNWRLPMACQALPCIVVFAGVWFLPESPRHVFLN